jgi:hypothetical protein
MTNILSSLHVGITYQTSVVEHSTEADWDEVSKNKTPMSTENIQST